MNAIFTRRSIRHFTDQAVEADKIEQLLRAAMQAPSAFNQQAWEFIVVQSREMLGKLASVSPYSAPAGRAPLAIIVVANKDKLKIPSAWEQDLGAATENLLLEAVDLGLGTVWMGVAISDETMTKVSDLLALPDNILPFGLIAVGYPANSGNHESDRFQPELIHHETW